MAQIKPQGLQGKFLAGLAAFLLMLGVLFGFTLNMHLKSLLEYEVADKARLILAHVEAVQLYVRKTLRPVMYEILPRDEFIIEAMSTSFVTRRVMEDLNLSDDGYVYRRVAEGARNPAFEAQGMEQDLITRFREQPKEGLYREFLKIDGEERYIAARPVVFEESCMSCHGHPDDAPWELIVRYGPERGFGRQVGEIAGLDLVILPVQSAVTMIREATADFVASFAVGVFIFFILLLAFFNRLVVHNLRRLASVLRNHFKGEADQTLLARLDQGDEIEELVHSMEAFAAHLGEARQQLRDHAANLEARVEERTRDLAREAGERRTDVQLFVELLASLNRSQTRRELLATALDRIGRRFGARGVAYTCIMGTGGYYSWPKEGRQPVLPTDWPAFIATGETRTEGCLAWIPVQTSEQSRGVLCLDWDDEDGMSAQSLEVLTAVGQQLGIALDNLDALDSILRQNDMLDSMFEGISDPLVLVDESCQVILANASARDLAASLGTDLEPGQSFLRALLGDDECSIRERITCDRPTTFGINLPDGRSFSISLYDLGYHGGRVVVYARETTAERRMLARMQQGEKMIAVGKLAAGLAHEINNPLGVILCYAQLLEASLPEGQGRDDVAVIVKHTRQAQKVLQDLLDYARTKPPSPGPCNPSATLQGLAQVFRLQAVARKLSLKADISDGLPLVSGDSSVLEQIVANLLLNAMDAAPQETGVVRLAARSIPGRDEILIQVSDNGPGIPDEDLARVFDPFFTTKEVGKGTGLGLSVAYGLLQDLGGRIEAENDGGAVFNLHIPAMAEPDLQGAEVST